jgi:hypothetical protein
MVRLQFEGVNKSILVSTLLLSSEKCITKVGDS